MTPAQQLALATFLHEWPDDLDFNDVLQLVECGDDLVTVCATFEYINSESLKAEINWLSIGIQQAIDNSPQEQINATKQDR